VLRNYAPIQYLQNGVITQSFPLHYIATSTILAGNNVEPDADVPDLDYSIEATGEVILEAANTIHLQEGFRAKEGCNFRAFTAQQSVSIPCPPFYNNPVAARLTAATKSFGHASLKVTPNPTHSIITLSYGNNAVVADKVQVRDVLGKLVFEKSNFNSASDVISIGDCPNGVYAVTVTTAGMPVSVKLVLSK
jgi:hypothetical protein